MIRGLIAFLCVLSATAGTAHAQGPSYLVAGGVIELPTRTVTASTTSDTISIMGFNAGVGFPLGKASLEFAGFWHTAESDIERDGELTITEIRIQNRDIPLVASVRYKPRCPDRWCAEVAGGFGINFSRRSTVRVGDCGTYPNYVSPCTPTQVPLSTSNKEEPTFFFGAAFTMRIMDRIDLGPAVRLWYVGRYRDQTQGHAAQIYNRRTPNNERLEVGFTAVWRLQ